MKGASSNQRKSIEPKQNPKKKKVFALAWMSGSHWTAALMYLGNDKGLKISTSWIKTRDSGQKLEILPRLRSSASVFFSPGMWWMLRNVLHRICWRETNLMISERTSVLEKPWLILASAPVLSDPDWTLIIPGLVVHFVLTKRRIQSWAKASDDVLYRWRLFGMLRKGCNSWLFVPKLAEPKDFFFRSDPTTNAHLFICRKSIGCSIDCHLGWPL